MQHEPKPIPTTCNRAIFSVLMLLHGLVLFGLPALLLHSTYWALILVPMAWLNIVHWGLIHEAIHKLLFPSPRANEIGGRLLAITMGASFHVLRFGHLMHHKLNRQFHSEHVAAQTLRTKLYYYLHLVAGLYLSELVIGWLFTLLPRRRFMHVARATFLKHDQPVATAGERFFYERGNIAATRLDATLAVLLYASAFYTYGAQWPWLLLFIAMRGLVISFMDNIYHYDTPADNSKPAKELRLPRFLSALILYGNFHETHHSNPDVPWHLLPVKHAAELRPFDGSFLHHGLQQFRGPGLKTSLA